MLKKTASHLALLNNYLQGAFSNNLVSFLKLNLILFSFSFFCLGCSEDKSDDKGSTTEIIKGFKNVTEGSGFDFKNLLDEETLLNPFNYINAHTGGGVAIGDINNDGLPDIYMTANMSTSKLFLNRGNMEFEDITISSKTNTEGWCTGVTMADVNQDGWLDIYVCKSYYNQPVDRGNLLFINNGDNTFAEKAKELGINDENFSIGASFLDYDMDGDLDVIVANHPRFRFVPLKTHLDYWKNPILGFSNRLFRNDGNSFSDVTEQSGILSYGFSLSVSTSDFNNDNYPDIFITVDHDEPDLIFKNNQDGTFTNILNSAINSSSLSSMGIDAGDLNNDRYPDFVVAEMLSQDHYREKINMSMQSVDRFNFLVDTIGYKYYQMHNFLYANNGNSTFSDLSQLTGVHKSDWSWSSLFMDYNNDGNQDIFFSNGVYRNFLHRDKKAKLDSVMISLNGDFQKMNKVAKEYSKNAPQIKLANVLFENQGNYRFENDINSNNLSEKTVSTGSAYGDLDNDGDLDLVVNNIGDPSFIYENISKGNNYLKVHLKQNKEQTRIGSKVYLDYGGQFQHRELLSARGFQSSSDAVIHFGLGSVKQVNLITIVWPNGRTQKIQNVNANQTLSIEYKNATSNQQQATKNIAFFETKKASSIGINFRHQENVYDDYNDQILLPHKLSEYGPHMAVGDINKDGMEDLYICGAHKQAGAIYVQNKNNSFVLNQNKDLTKDKVFEDGDAQFVDVDGDDDLDLIVVSTGYEFDGGDDRYVPRLYLNDGSGHFSRKVDAFPAFSHSSACITSTDLDGDGDIDIFIGGRLNPKQYPRPGTSALMINDGTGKFTNQISELTTDLEHFGMIKDAAWTDFNDDGRPDLIVIGEWTYVGFFENVDGQLKNKSDQYFDMNTKGWWNTLSIADIDQDGSEDIVLGNLGYNYKYKASKDKPFTVYGKDFDNNGNSDIVLATYYGDEVYPVRGKNCSSEQMPELEQKFKTFESFAHADLIDVYGEDLKTALKYEATEFGSMVLFKESIGKYTSTILPPLAQASPINGIIIRDIDNDSDSDIIIAGNLYQSEIETGRADSGTGYIIENLGDRKFKTKPVHKSGIDLREDVKSLYEVKVGTEPITLVGINNGTLKFLKLAE